MKTKPMSAVNLVQCLAGEHLAMPEMMLEAIKENEDFLAIVRQYGAGKATYEQVLEVSKDYL